MQLWIIKASADDFELSDKYEKYQIISTFQKHSKLHILNVEKSPKDGPYDIIVDGGNVVWQEKLWKIAPQESIETFRIVSGITMDDIKRINGAQ